MRAIGAKASTPLRKQIGKELMHIGRKREKMTGIGEESDTERFMRR